MMFFYLTQRFREEKKQNTRFSLFVDKYWQDFNDAPVRERKLVINEMKFADFSRSILGKIF